VRRTIEQSTTLMQRKQLLALILESEHELDEDSVSPVAVLLLIGALIVLFVAIVQTGG
jgi:hypothetical protein